ncbi:MAG TPA: DNA-processing protein DprA [Steroidobacteraceae bacterium]|nr:DNA-processing protein DprA [Steroidobacteraceae bacterium]
MDDLRAAALLARTPSLTADHVRALVAATGSLDGAASVGSHVVAGIELPPAARAFLAAPDHAAIDADLRWIEESGARVIPVTSERYPSLLAAISRAPAVLYVLGDVEVLSSPQLAIVGSRSPTATGRSTAREFAAFFARAGLTITSGLALGIDAASHEGALAAEGLTVAVCGCGLDVIYPRQHAELAARIRERGALVSEFPPRTPPLPGHFPRRNRVISGLSYGTLVVEAAHHSGSLITAQHALEQGREVFAIPGSIHNPLARGCHKLIAAGAKLVEGAADVLSELGNFIVPQGLASSATAPADSSGAALKLDKEYEILLDALGFEPASIDVLVSRTGFPTESVASMLLILELQGRITPRAGGRYARNRN